MSCLADVWFKVADHGIYMVGENVPLAALVTNA